MLDYNIGQYYNYWIAPYAPPTTHPARLDLHRRHPSVASGGPRRRSGPTTLHYPNGFPNPADRTYPAAASTGESLLRGSGNHDEATILGPTTTPASIRSTSTGYYNGKPIGDAYDHQNNIIKDPPYPSYSDQIDEKTGSIKHCWTTTPISATEIRAT